MWKKMGLTVLCIALLLVTGCDEKEKAKEQEELGSYRESSLVFRVQGDFQGFTLIGIGEKDFYYCFRQVMQSESEEGQEELCFYRQGLEKGSEPVRLHMNIGELLYRNALVTIDEEGKERLVLLLGEEKDEQLQYALYEYDKDGKLQTIIQTGNVSGDYPEKFKKLSDGSYALVSNKSFWIIGMSGQRSCSIPCPGVEYIGLVEGNGGEIAVTYTETDGSVMLALINRQKQVLSVATDISGNGQVLCLQQKKIFYVDERGIYQYTASDGMKRQVLDLSGRNIDAYQIVDIRLEGDEIQILGYSADGKAAKYIIYTKGENQTPSNEEDSEKYDAYGRRYIYLYDYSGSWPKYSMDSIDAFNEQSDKYQVVVRDYEYDSMDIHKIVAEGKFPDLICSEYNSLIAGFREKEILEDLTPYINASKKLSLEDLSETIVKAYTEEGRLFGLPNTFELRALYGPEQYLGEPGWTVEEYLDWLAIHPSPGPMATRNAILDACMPALLEQYVDWDKGEAYFDSEAFCITINKLKALNRIKEFTKEEVLLNKELYEMDEAALDFTISNPSSYVYFAEETRGVDMVIKGYPSVDGTPVAYIEAGALSIMSTSEVKEGAYEFLEFYLLYRTEELSAATSGSSRFWTVKQKMQEDLEGLLEADNYLGWPCSYSREQLEEIMDVIPHGVLKDYSMQELEELIKGELEAFFQGQKNAEAVSKIIQNRVQLYMDERGE